MSEDVKEKKKMRRSEEDKNNLLITTYRFSVWEDRLSDKMRLYLEQSFGNQRFVWNHFLNEMNLFYQSQETLKKSYTDNRQAVPEGFRTFLSFQDMCKMLTQLKKNPAFNEQSEGESENNKVSHFLNNTHSQPLQSTLRFLSDAMAEFVKGKKGKPRFKKKNLDDDGCFFKQLNSFKFSLREGWLGLPGTKEKLFVRFHRLWKQNETPKTLSLTRKGNKIWVNVQVERKLSTKEKQQQQDNLYNVLPEKTLAYDLGCSKMLMTQQGQTFHPEKTMRDKLKRIADRIIFLQRQISHKMEVFRKKKEKNPGQKISKQYIKLKNKIAKLYEKATNIKNDFLHKASCDIGKNHTCVIREDLDIKHMTMNTRRIKLHADPVYQEKLRRRKKEKPWLKALYDKRDLNRRILSMSWGMFNNMVEYKVRRNMGFVVKVNPAYTSQRCSECSYTAEENRQTQAEFICQDCGFSCNADHNAARNIYQRGILSLQAGWVATETPFLSFRKKLRQSSDEIPSRGN